MAIVLGNSRTLIMSRNDHLRPTVSQMLELFAHARILSQSLASVLEFGRATVPVDVGPADAGPEREVCETGVVV